MKCEGVHVVIWVSLDSSCRELSNEYQYEGAYVICEGVICEGESNIRPLPLCRCCRHRCLQKTRDTDLGTTGASNIYVDNIPAMKDTELQPVQTEKADLSSN